MSRYGEIVSTATLFEKGLVSRNSLPVKILGKEKLTVKVKFEGVKLSEPVKTQL